MKMWTAMAVVCVLARGAWGDDLPRIASLKSGIEPANLSGKIEERPSGGSIHTGGSGSDSVVEEKKRTKSDPVPQGGEGTEAANASKIAETVTGLQKVGQGLETGEPSLPPDEAGAGDSSRVDALLVSQLIIDSTPNASAGKIEELTQALQGVVFGYSYEPLVRAAVGSLLRRCAETKQPLDEYTWMCLEDAYPDEFEGVDGGDYEAYRALLPGFSYWG